MEADQYETTAFGRAERVPGKFGYVAYFPEPVPRDLDLPAPTIRMLADVEWSLGRLSAVVEGSPDRDGLVRRAALREALASTRIEGTDTTLEEVLAAEAGEREGNPDTEEVLNHLEASSRGIELIEELPFSVRMLRELHRRLIAGVRGEKRTPGELRRSQNWIGPAGATIETAPYVPPPPEEVAPLLADWERFANELTRYPPLIQCALLHSQFETIHPFLDGNGRLGRMLIVLFLVAHGRVPAPVLGISTYLERNRGRYYGALQRSREAGDPFVWIDLFLQALRDEAEETIRLAGDGSEEAAT